jgi:hypothetical protein
MRFSAQQHHDMTRLLRRKALKASAPEAMQRKAIGFLALAKTANKQRAVNQTPIPALNAAPAQLR